MAVATDRPPASDAPSSPPPAGATAGEGAIAGIVAAGVALGVGELVCALGAGQATLVTSVGTRFIDQFAGSLKDLAVSLFGTNDKAALVTGIVILSLAFGAALGVASVRRRWIGIAGFTAFGAVGLWSYLDNPLGSTATGIVAAILAVTAGVATLLGLLHLLALAPRPAAGATGADAPATAVGDAGAGTRRLFLTAAGSLAVIAAGAALLAKRLRRTDVVDRARGAVALPPPATTAAPTTGATGTIPAIPGLTPYVTANGDFYRIDTAITVPQVDVANWKLEVVGMVDREVSFTYGELLDMATFEDVVTMQCVSNDVGGHLVGNARWQGVPLRRVLDEAGVQRGATQVVGHSVDGFTAGFPTAVALDGRTAMVAVAMNGEPLPAVHGFPARLLVAGLYGYVSATKWLDEIRLVRWEDFDGYWIDLGWAKEGPIKLASRIDVPSSGATVDPGRQAIAGVAWQPDVGVSKVEVKIDDGPWQPATLGGVVSDNTWVQWYLPWDATSGEHLLSVRATNAKGELQIEQPATPAPDGATGYHYRSVRVR